MIAVHNKQNLRNQEPSTYKLDTESFRSYLEGLSGFEQSLTVGLEGLASSIGVEEDFVMESLTLLLSKGKLRSITRDPRDGQMTILFRGEQNHASKSKN